MDDLIYRQAAIDAVQGIGRLATLPDNDVVVRMSAVEYVLFNLPSAQPDNQTNLCDSCDYSYPDCPSKNDDVIFGNDIGNDNICACNKYKPSVQPERKKGKWDTTLRDDPLIKTCDCICSICGGRTFGATNFCPNCGADMRGENE